MARPQSPRGGKKGVLVAVRLSIGEKQFLANRAEDEGKSLADLLRDRLLFDLPAYQLARTVDRAIGGGK